MIVAIWHRWVQSGQWWWLLVLGSVALMDILIGSWLISQELRILKEVMK